MAWIPYKQIAKPFSTSMLVILDIISKLTYNKTLTVLINGIKRLIWVYVTVPVNGANVAGIQHEHKSTYLSFANRHQEKVSWFHRHADCISFFMLEA